MIYIKCITLTLYVSIVCRFFLKNIIYERVFLHLFFSVCMIYIGWFTKHAHLHFSFNNLFIQELNFGILKYT